MSTTFTELRSQAMQVDTGTSAPTSAEGELSEGRVYFDTSTGRLYAYVNAAWRFVQFTSTSTSSTSTSSTSSSTSTTSTSSSSISTTTTSSSTSSTSSSTTIY